MTGQDQKYVKVKWIENYGTLGCEVLMNLIVIL
jgi:hypothetical protein